jgi:hypothetical protein
MVLKGNGGNYTVEELLLFSSVSGTGLDVVMLLLGYLRKTMKEYTEM